MESVVHYCVQAQRMSSLVCGMLKFSPPWVYLIGAFDDAALVSAEPFSAALGLAIRTHLKVGRAAEHWDAHPLADAASLDMLHRLRRCISTIQGWVHIHAGGPIASPDERTTVRDVLRIGIKVRQKLAYSASTSTRSRLVCWRTSRKQLAQNRRVDANFFCDCGTS